MTASERLSEAIRVELARRRLNQQALADSVGIARSTMSRKMLGASEFTVDELDRIARALGVTAGDLLANDTKASA
ncbi:helix-turn-helix transcriptional regulator [Mycolicibacterium peregrinum]|uniref:helix-turn-helix transcriptional regulator n=1 Tax=Mycolicibacterium peregrinum TaxID=43304 RepID=UPI0006D788EA|nr:helix-turn-helix transcriptional regulator [Mycolicibacterium peregrinum]MCV7205271.1 helix-turn-helix transcriptional regulator [Mycolicibacterium peregrinum]ORW54828.1 hypothetical protein AWC21_24120 [Mycolicibacterium peregrinum]